MSMHTHYKIWFSSLDESNVCMNHSLNILEFKNSQQDLI